MKNIPLILIFIFLFSCTQPDTKDEKQNSGKVSFAANGKNVNLSKNAFEIVEGNLKLKSFSGDTLRLELTICDGIAKTSYEISGDGANGILYFPGDGTRNFYPSYNDGPTGNLRGRVEITDINEKNQTMSGTFSAQLSRTSSPEMKIGDSTEMTITNGAFTNVPYKIPEGPTGSLPIAKIDQEEFKGALTSSGYGSIIEFTFSDKYQQLGFRFSDDITVGEHKISEFNDYTIFPNIWYMEGIHSYKARSGTVTITEVTLHKHIKGTFSFEVESYPVAGKTKSITEGSFDITFSN